MCSSRSLILPIETIFPRYSMQSRVSCKLLLLDFFLSSILLKFLLFTLLFYTQKNCYFLTTALSQPGKIKKMDFLYMHIYSGVRRFKQRWGYCLFSFAEEIHYFWFPKFSFLNLRVNFKLHLVYEYILCARRTALEWTMQFHSKVFIS